MQTDSKAIKEAIIRCNKAHENQINNLSRTCKMSPHLVKRHFDGSPLSIYELRKFADWRSRLPNEDETNQILLHGVDAMKNLFKQTY